MAGIASITQSLDGLPPAPRAVHVDIYTKIQPKKQQQLQLFTNKYIL